MWLLLWLWLLLLINGSGHGDIAVVRCYCFCCYKEAFEMMTFQYRLNLFWTLLVDSYFFDWSTALLYDYVFKTKQQQRQQQQQQLLVKRCSQWSWCTHNDMPSSVIRISLTCQFSLLPLSSSTTLLFLRIQLSLLNRHAVVVWNQRVGQQIRSSFPAFLPKNQRMCIRSREPGHLLFLHESDIQRQRQRTCSSDQYAYHGYGWAFGIVVRNSIGEDVKTYDNDHDL